MRGCGTCKEADESVNLEWPNHCVHPRGGPHFDCVCCWCGDLFEGDLETPDAEQHGEYLPGYQNPVAEKRRLAARHRSRVGGFVVLAPAWEYREGPVGWAAVLAHCLACGAKLAMLEGAR